MNNEAPNTYDELIASFESGGEVSFDMSAKNKRTMKKCMDRMNKLQRAFGKAS